MVIADPVDDLDGSAAACGVDRDFCSTPGRNPTERVPGQGANDGDHVP